MNRARFEALAREAIETLPEEIRAHLDNVALVIEDRPAAGTEEDRDDDPDQLLLGLYEGLPLTSRDSGYGLVCPDKITLYQTNLEAVCCTAAELKKEIRLTVLHEVAHHFGIDEERLRELGY